MLLAILCGRYIIRKKEWTKYKICINIISIIKVRFEWGMKFRENGNTCVIIYTLISDPPLISFLESSNKEFLSPSSIFSLVFYNHLISSNGKIIIQAIIILSHKKKIVFFNIPHLCIPSYASIISDSNK